MNGYGWATLSATLVAKAPDMMLRTESAWLQTETVPDKAKAAVSPEIQMTQTESKPRL